MTFVSPLQAAHSANKAAADSAPMARPCTALSPRSQDNPSDVSPDGSRLALPAFCSLGVFCFKCSAKDHISRKAPANHATKTGLNIHRLLISSSLRIFGYRLASCYRLIRRLPGPGQIIFASAQRRLSLRCSIILPVKNLSKHFYYFCCPPLGEHF